MDILIVSATRLELPILPGFLEKEEDNRKTKFDWLVTGIGSAVTTYALMSYLRNRRPDCIIQAGVGGSYDENRRPGKCVFVNEEVFADLGALENGNLVNLFDLKLADPDDKPFTAGSLKNISHFPGKRPLLEEVKGATVNAISSTKEYAEKIKSRYDAVVESMEGAALHYVCLQEDIPFLQLRAISNFAGDRNKSNWKMKEALEALNRQLVEILSSFNE